MLKKQATLAQVAVGAFVDELEKLSQPRERNLSVIPSGGTAPAPAQTYKDAPTAPGKKPGVLGAPAVPTPGAATAKPKMPAPAGPPA